MGRRKAYGKGHIEQVGRNKWAIELSGGRDPRTGAVYHMPNCNECPGVIYTHEIPPKALAVSRSTKRGKGGEERGSFYRRVRPQLRFEDATRDEQGMHFWQIPVVYLRAYETVLGTKREAELRVEEMRIELEILGGLLEAGIDEKDIAAHGLSIRGARESHMGASDLIEEYERRIADAGTSTFAQWCELYLSTREKARELRENTCRADRFYSKHLLNGLGDMKLTEIRAKDVKNLYADMKVAGVGASTIWHCHKLLKAILNDALVNELIIRNPADSVKAPKRPKPKRRSLSADQARRLRDIASKCPLEAYRVAVYLGLALGARLGEVLGLQWKHIVTGGDEGFPYIEIVQQYLGRGKTGPLKTDEDGNPIGRKVPLDASTFALLEKWKQGQLASLSALGLEQGPDTPIVTSGSGAYADKHNFSSWFRSWCADNGFGHWEDDEGRRIVDLEYGSDDASLYDGCVIVWRDASGWPCDENGRRYSRSYKRPVMKRHYRGLVFHELRHTHFTLRLDNGTSIPVAMALGGWKSSRMLYETYVHATPEKIWDEADFMDSVLSASKSE